MGNRRQKSISSGLSASDCWRAQFQPDLPPREFLARDGSDRARDRAFELGQFTIQRSVYDLDEPPVHVRLLAGPISQNLSAMICHQYNCIFIHVPKCAGQSVEQIFLDAVGLSWDSRAPLLLRLNDKPELGPPRLAHLTARDYVACKYVTPQQFENYFKFSIVRNPWDRMVSFYKYLGFYKCADFKRFLGEYFMHRLWTRKYWFVRPQYEFIYNEQCECMVDYVGRFECLQKCMNHIGNRIGLEIPPVPRINKSYKTLPKPAMQIGELYRYTIRRYVNRTKTMLDDYRAYYDEESISRVAHLYKRDIELFGYEFEPQSDEPATTKTLQSAC